MVTVGVVKIASTDVAVVPAGDVEKSASDTLLCALVLGWNTIKLGHRAGTVNRPVSPDREIEYAKMACERNQERIANVARVRDVTHDGGEHRASNNSHH